MLAVRYAALIRVPGSRDPDSRVGTWQGWASPGQHLARVCGAQAAVQDADQVPVRLRATAVQLVARRRVQSLHKQKALKKKALILVRVSPSIVIIQVRDFFPCRNLCLFL